MIKITVSFMVFPSANWAALKQTENKCVQRICVWRKQHAIFKYADLTTDCKSYSLLPYKMIFGTTVSVWQDDWLHVEQMIPGKISSEKAQNKYPPLYNILAVPHVIPQLGQNSVRSNLDYLLDKRKYNKEVKLCATKTEKENPQEGSTSIWCTSVSWWLKNSINFILWIGES